LTWINVSYVCADNRGSERGVKPRENPDSEAAEQGGGAGEGGAKTSKEDPAAAGWQLLLEEKGKFKLVFVDVILHNDLWRG